MRVARLTPEQEAEITAARAIRSTQGRHRRRIQTVTPSLATPANGNHTKPALSQPAKSIKEFPDCRCGCGEKTRGGRFRPGHDARYYARLAKEGK